ncbi:MAG TPA: hypothetical protein VMT08_27040 [Bradyrhizobium sp.]|nr:hypothetical protein [Bradyrhizobium sp.]
MAQRYSKETPTATQPPKPQKSPSRSLKRVRASDPLPISATDADAPAIANIEGYIDTVGISYPRRPKGLLSEARAILGRKVWFSDIVDASGKRWGTRLPLHQPTPELLRALDQYGGCVSRADVAFDIFPLHMTLAEMAAFVRTNALLRWRRPQAMFDCETTLYWTEKHGEGDRPDRNLAEYHDLPSKLNGKPTVHIELRFQTSDACKAENLHQPSDLGKLNPRELFEKHIRIIDFERHIQRDVQSSITPRRTRGLYLRYDDRVQLFKDRHPQVAKRMPALNSLFNIGNRLTWGAVSGAKDHHTWQSAGDPSSALIMQPNPQIGRKA